MRRRPPRWWTLGWRSRYDINLDRPQLVWSLCLSDFNLPRLSWGHQAGGWYLVFSYGNGNSDPAFSIGIEKTAPEILEHWRERAAQEPQERS